MLPTLWDQFVNEKHQVDVLFFLFIVNVNLQYTYCAKQTNTRYK